MTAAEGNTRTTTVDLARAAAASGRQMPGDLEASLEVAALGCATPVALISLIGEDRVWLRDGGGPSEWVEVPREFSESVHAGGDGRPREIRDLDPDTGSPDRSGESRWPAFPFFASAPIVDRLGRIGSMCVLDRRPFRLSATQGEVLSSLASGAARRLEAARLGRSLAASEARYRSMAETSSDMTQCLGLDGRRLYASQAAHEIFGLPARDLVGTHPVDFVHDDDRDRVAGLIADLAAGRSQSARSVHRIRHADGRWIWVDVRFSAVTDAEDGSTVEIVSTLRDVSEREGLHQQLGRNNHSLRLAEEIAHVGHWRVELPGYGVTWSDEVYRIHGLDPETFRPTLESGISAYHPDDREAVSAQVSAAIERRQGFDFRLRILRPGGEVRHVVSRGLCEVDPRTDELKAIFGVFMDVTGLEEAERALKQTSALLRTTLDHMDQALVKVAADGTVELANRRVAEMLDVPADALRAPKPRFDRIFGQNHDARPTAAARLTPGTFEQPRPDGKGVLEVRTVAVEDGAFVRTYIDITARRHAEAALRDSEARHRILAETSNDIVTQLDLGARRIYVSPACRRVLGYEPEEMIGVRPSDSIHPDDVVAVRDVARRLADGRIDGDRVVTTYRARHKLGHWVWLEAGMNLVRDSGSNEPVCLTCTLRDVTERQRAARHLEQARAAAEQAAVAKADFLANMSHELRTPLTGMLGIHDLLRTDPGLSPNQQRLVGLAAEAGQSLLAIVNDVLDFSKIEAGQLKIERVPFALGPMLEGCRSLAGEGAKGRPLSVEVSAAQAPAWLVGDPTRLRQIVLNLLTNAVKFTPAGTVRAEARYDPGAGRLRVEVRDTGIGVAAEDVPKLFDRFSQADTSTTRRFGGTGLGLAISKRLVEMMGGRIGAESVVGRGSTFWFELPLDSHGGETASAAADATTTRATLRVLLAEDNAMNREIISTMLSHHGYTVTAVPDGAAAVEALRHADQYDVVLMDLQMPIMDGLTATATVRAEAPGGSPRLPIIGLTANAMAEDVERCIAAGMDAHVAKPIRWPDLFAAMIRLTTGDDAEATVGSPSADAVIDERILEDLAGVIGERRLATMLRLFEADLRRRLAEPDCATPAALADQAHSLAGTAGQFGFVSLSRRCARIEAAARRDQGLDGIRELRDAVARAADAARSSRFAALADT